MNGLLLEVLRRLAPGAPPEDPMRGSVMAADYVAPTDRAQIAAGMARIPGGLLDLAQEGINRLPTGAGALVRAATGGRSKGAGQAARGLLGLDAEGPLADAVEYGLLGAVPALALTGRAGGGALPAGFARNQAGAIVWHGSPHKFDRFDSSKIGTGEGAQAYGHGLYVAESPEVAKSYQQLANTVLVDGKPILARNARVGTTGNSYVDDLLVMHMGDVKAATQEQIKHVQELRQRFASQPRATAPSMVGVEDRILKDAQRDLALLRSLRGRTTMTNDGHLYKVDLADEAIPKMLDWDKPFSRQTSDAQRLILTALDERKRRTGGYGLFDPLERTTGKDLVPAIGEERGRPAT